MIILGLDPGSRLTGFGLVKKNGNHATHVENGTLYAAQIENYPERLAYLWQSVQELIRKYGVDEVAVENIFYHKNPKSVQKLGEVRGVLMASAASLGKPVYEYTALQVKQAVTGYGKAEKGQIQMMVRKLLNLRDLAEENASDALGIALCHAHQNRPLRFKGSGDCGSLTEAQELLKKASFYR